MSLVHGERVTCNLSLGAAVCTCNTGPVWIQEGIFSFLLFKTDSNDRVSADHFGEFRWISLKVPISKLSIHSAIFKLRSLTQCVRVYEL